MTHPARRTRSLGWLAAVLLAAVPAAVPAAVAAAQPSSAAPLRLAALQALESNADEVVEVALDGELLRLASGLVAAGDDTGADPEVHALLGQLRGVYVNSYLFDAEGAYDRGILGRLRGDLGAGWQRMVNVRSRDRENVEVWVRPAGGRFDGLVVLAAEPRELTVVQLVGPVDLDTLAGLEGQLGVPRLGLAADGGKAER
ncbi:MAG TPA: DUF4252 domain-containing protein [Thermoanaerobaculia bacterium]|nr:DUF4252 domain-containing protein [Thermoanaerobaculia bacterium]